MIRLKYSSHFSRVSHVEIEPFSQQQHSLKSLKVVKMLRNEKKVGIVYGGSGSNFLCVMERHWTHRKTNILARVNYCSPTNIWWVWCLVFICWSEYYWSTSHENFLINRSGFEVSLFYGNSSLCLSVLLMWFLFQTSFFVIILRK